MYHHLSEWRRCGLYLAKKPLKNHSVLLEYEKMHTSSSHMNDDQSYYEFN